MKLISWNVNGLRACIGKGFLDFVNFIDADVICLQETKLQPHQIELDLPQYHIYWNSADKKGYSGTAVFTKQEPLSVTYDFGEDIHRHEGRVITCEYPDFYLVCCYTPNSQDELPPFVPHGMGGCAAAVPLRARHDQARRVLRGLKRRTRGDRPQKSEDEPL